MNKSIIQNKKICLAVTVEADLININTKNKELFDFDGDRYYETESLLLFKSWRKNAGKLKNIAIYALCTTGNEPSEKTLKEYEELEVIYISEYKKETKNFVSGFWNIPFGGMWFEKNLDEDIIIKLDLDMEVLREIPDDLFGLKDGGSVVGIFDEYQHDLYRSKPSGGMVQTNTCLMVSYRKAGVYTEWYKEVKLMTALAQSDPMYLKKYNLKFDEIEEFSFDYMIANNMFSGSITYIDKFQLGDNYPKLELFKNEEIQKIYFWHEHYRKIQRKEKIREQIAFKRRIIDD